MLPHGRILSSALQGGVGGVGSVPPHAVGRLEKQHKNTEKVKEPPAKAFGRGGPWEAREPRQKSKIRNALRTPPPSQGSRNPGGSLEEV